MKIIFFIILCISLWGFYRLISQLVKFLWSSNWPTGECKIVDAKIDEELDSVDILAFLFPSFYPKIEYTYNVKGESYKSERISFDKDFHYKSFLGFPGAAKAAKLLTKYRKGKTATLFYDPNNPSYSILVREIHIIKSFITAILLSSLMSYSLIGLYNIVIRV